MAAAASAAAAAAAARRKKILSSGAFGIVATVTAEDFVRAIAMEPAPLVLRSIVKSFWSDEIKKHRYLAAVRGMAFFCESTEEIALNDDAIVIETEKLTVPGDL